MKNIVLNQEFIRKYEPEFGGVFSISDLKSLFKFQDQVSLYRQIKQLIEAKFLSNFVRGIYVTKNFNPYILSQRIIPNSYISLGTVLAQELLIGSIPQKTVYAIRVGKNRTFNNHELKIVYYGITKNLFFGFYNKENLKFANKEKAFLDTLYFYQKGKKFSFNIYQDINLNRLDKNIVNNYLIQYKNKKFVKFVKDILYGN